MYPTKPHTASSQRTPPIGSRKQFRCPGEVNTASTIRLSTLHPLRRRGTSPVPSPREDPPLFTTVSHPPTQTGALLLSLSYLLVHFLIPRMRNGANANMESTENGGTFRSGLRAPQVHTSTTTTMAPSAYLQEITNSDQNARPHPSGLLPSKRTYNGAVPDRDAKRKTLAERAGEPISKSQLPAATPSVSRMTGIGLKPTSIASLASTHQTATATSSRPPTTLPGTSRHASTNSFSRTMGAGSRPPISGRAPSSMGFNPSNTRGTTRSRPATVMSGRSAEEDGGPADQKKSRNFSASLQPRTNKVRTQRGRSTASEQSVGIRARMPSKEELTLSKRMGNLSLNDDVGDIASGNQVISKAKEHSLSLMFQPPDGQEQRSSTLQNRRGGATSPDPFRTTNSQANFPSVPVTPPEIRNGRVALEKLGTTVRSIAQTPCSPTKSPSPKKLPFLTKDSHLKTFTGWDVDGRLHEFETQFKEMKEAFDTTITDRKALEEAIQFAKNRASDLEREQQRLMDQTAQLQGQISSLQHDNLSMQQEKQSLILQFESERQKHKYELQDKSREHQHDVEEIKRGFKAEVEQMKWEHQQALEAMERQYRAEMKDRQAQNSKELEELRAKLGSKQEDMNLEVLRKDRQIQELRSLMEGLKLDLDREQTVKGNLQQKLTEMSTTNMTLEDRLRGLNAKIEFLESDSKQQSDSFAHMEARLQDALRVAEEAREKLIKEETERRVLFNKYQELKGNIRVMCRVRPVLGNSEGNPAQISFPDEKTSAQIDVTQEEKNSMGMVSRKVVPFEFDRVFSPAVHNEEIFGEISQLVQSALDGYNVCIFCYGQTGSGKTYTMSSPDGMIPRATHMIYETITKLKEKSWTYTMEGSFVEVYNEELHDLLTPGRESDGKKRLEIRHDDSRKQTTVLNCKTVALDLPDKVEMMLKQAQNNRSVAATKANERSSRSHSVFILKLVGENSATNERCEGTLNLVDLAGSERLKHSQAEGERMRETQNINKSLACLGDVIEALGRGSGHVPYRNSKLTHLLQYSLSGNSKTLMFVMVSPLEAHLKETITSLRFATKVHNTHIGTAKSTKKLVKDRATDY
ncbi:kinesin-like nuclear fusion protein [Podospora pseudocomata]|uniref:Kinesin-like nuclear fusion protein n=1 Tax=Podospora pseudocomata TaxID=2093779 RepID=A0ABR0GQR7_9PEZI|nr:kinesin-like nuclear fusion protein [Podospora pseudocomata]